MMDSHDTWSPAMSPKTIERRKPNPPVLALEDGVIHQELLVHLLDDRHDADGHRRLRRRFGHSFFMRRFVNNVLPNTITLARFAL